MQKIPLYRLYTIADLNRFMNHTKKVKLYGAGYYLELFLQGLENLDINYKEKIDLIMVSDTNRNPENIKGISVVCYLETSLGESDYVLLTLGHRYTEQIYDLLKDTGAHIAWIDFSMFQKEAYQEIKEELRPFLETFIYEPNEFNSASSALGRRTKAWTCWWQGAEQAPEIVRLCWESQKRNLPSGTEFVIISEKNYEEYIDLPDYIISKVKSGDISFTTLSDIIRAALLYKYGGFWMDATLLVLSPLPKEILSYQIYTRTLPETQYCTNVVWADWFLYVTPGNKLFKFLSEAFLYYYLCHKRIKYYFMVDYIIAIACNTFPDVEEQMKLIPYNNEKALELAKHLTEKFDEIKYKSFVEDTLIQKLTYKINWGELKEKGSIYEYLLKN